MLKPLTRHLPLLALLWLTLTQADVVHAQTFAIPFPNATTVVGHFLDNNTWMGSTLDNVNCTWQRIGSAGLTADTTIQGTSGRDSVFIVETGNLHICGLSLAPPKRNGFRIGTRALGGPDTLIGGDFADGGDGDDVIRLTLNVISVAMGGDGQDLIWGNRNAMMDGGKGNDTFCSSVASFFLDGGDDSDQSCTLDGSTPPALQTQNLEKTQSCAPCR